MKGEYTFAQLGRKRCNAYVNGRYESVCNEWAIGAIIERVGDRTYARCYGCSEHLDRATKELLVSRMTAGQVVAMVARGG